MNNYSQDINVEDLTQSAGLVLKSYMKRYKEIKLDKYLTWCVFKNIDARISSEILIKYIEIYNDNYVQHKYIVNDLKEKLYRIVSKKGFSYKDNHNAYEIMSDIIIVLERSKKIYLNNTEKSRFLKIVSNIILWIKNKVKTK